LTVVANIVEIQTHLNIQNDKRSTEYQHTLHHQPSNAARIPNNNKSSFKNTNLTLCTLFIKPNNPNSLSLIKNHWPNQKGSLGITVCCVARATCCSSLVTCNIICASALKNSQVEKKMRNRKVPYLFVACVSFDDGLRCCSCSSNAVDCNPNARRNFSVRDTRHHPSTLNTRHRIRRDSARPSSRNSSNSFLMLFCHPPKRSFSLLERNTIVASRAIASRTMTTGRIGCGRQGAADTAGARTGNAGSVSNTSWGGAEGGANRVLAACIRTDFARRVP
jgi:hypothetical protein